LTNNVTDANENPTHNMAADMGNIFKRYNIVIVVDTAKLYLYLYLQPLTLDE